MAVNLWNNMDSTNVRKACTECGTEVWPAPGACPKCDGPMMWTLQQSHEVSRQMVRERVLRVLKRDLSPWVFDGSEPMCQSIFEAIEAPIVEASTQTKE